MDTGRVLPRSVDAHLHAAEHPGVSCSERIAADDLAPLGGAQSPPGREADRVLDVPDAPVSHPDVDASGMPAPRRIGDREDRRGFGARRIALKGILAVSLILH